MLHGSIKIIYRIPGYRNYVRCFIQLTDQNLSGSCSFGHKKVAGFLGHGGGCDRIHNRDNGSCLIPFVQRTFVKGVEELIHIIDAAWLNDDTGESQHPDAYELRAEASLVSFCPVAAHNHFKLAVWTKEILKQNHVNVYGAVIILQNADSLALLYQVFRIFFYKTGFTGTKESGYQVNFQHCNVISRYQVWIWIKSLAVSDQRVYRSRNPA